MNSRRVINSGSNKYGDLEIPRLDHALYSILLKYSSWIITLILLAYPPATQAETPSPHPLAHYVPADVDLMLQWQKLTHHFQLIAQSDMQRRFLEWPPLLAWRNSPEFRELNAIHLEWQKLSTSTFLQTLLKFTGDAGCLLVDHTDDRLPEFACIFHAESQSYARTIVQHWNTIESAQIEQETTGKFTYHKRTTSTRQVLYYVFMEQDFLVSDSLAFLSRILLVDSSNTGPTASINSKPFYQNSLAAVSSDSVVQVIVNPEWLHLQLVPILVSLKEPMQNKLKQKVKEISMLTCDLNVKNGCHLHIAINSSSPNEQSNSQTIPKTGQNKLTQLFPHDSFLMYYQQSAWENTEFQHLFLELFHTLQQNDELKQLVKVWKGLLGNLTTNETLFSLGPDIGFSLKLNIDRMVPVDILLAVELPSIDKQPEMHLLAKEAIERVSSALIYYLNITWNSTNQSEQPALLRAEILPQHSKRWMEQVASWSPGYAISDKWWYASSDINWINHALSPPTDTRTISSDTIYLQAEKQHFPLSDLVFWCDFSKLKSFTIKHKQKLINEGAWFGSDKPEVLLNRHEQFVKTFNLADAFYLTFNQIGPQQHLKLGLIVDSPNK